MVYLLIVIHLDFTVWLLIKLVDFFSAGEIDITEARGNGPIPSSKTHIQPTHEGRDHKIRDPTMWEVHLIGAH